MDNFDKIVCFGKNYPEHIKELGDDPVDKPVIFLKPASCLVQARTWDDQFLVPLIADAVDYECELVILLGAGGYKMTSNEVQAAIKAYSVGLDLTQREVQQELKGAGHPWTVSKVFPSSAILAPWIPYKDGVFEEVDFSLVINNIERQRGKVSDMLMKPFALIEYASNFFKLCPGDILFTGTPKGVGRLEPGQCGIISIVNNSLPLTFIPTV